MVFLSFDEWNGNIDNGATIPAYKTAIHYLEQMDGQKHTQVLLSSDTNNDTLLVGGGNNGLFVCTFTQDEEVFYNLINQKASESEEIELTTGGQAGFFAANICNDIKQVKKAFEYYLLNCSMEETLFWEQD